MPGSVERWLQTFMCTQYAHIFEAYGYRSLQAVCHLQMPHLLAMGVPRGHCEKILENIYVLRQTMFGRIQKPPESVTDFHHIKYNPPLNPAAYALKSVAMNANYRGMSQFPEEYSGYGQNASNMQAVGYHQGNYDGANMAMMSHMSGGSSGYGMPGYDASQGQMMMSGQAPLPAHYQSPQHQQAAYLAHQQQYYAGGNSSSGTSGTAGQYSQQYAMQGSSSGSSSSVQGMSGSSASYYTSGSAGSGGQGSPSSKMAPPPHHHLRNTSGPQNPQQVADNILQMASAYPSHHTVQVPLKNRHAPYQIPRSPHYGYTADKGMAAQQGMSGQQTGSCQQTISNQPQHQQPGMGGMGQASALMYLPSSPHSQPQPRTSPMSPLMMHSPASHQQSLPSPGSMHSPNSASVHSPAQSPNLRSPCSMPMSAGSMSICSPGHMPSGFSTQQMSSPPHRTYCSSDVPMSGQQHCTPTSMHSPVSHVGSPYGMSGQMSSPPHQVYSASSSTSPYKMDVLMDSGQGPGGQGPCAGGQTLHKQQGTNPLQSLQKLVMLPETQVVDPKSVVSDACLPGSDQGSSGECSKNGEDPAGQSEEAVGCSAGSSAKSSPVTCQSSTSRDTSSGVTTLCDRTGTIMDGPTSPSVQPESSCLAPCQNLTLSSGTQSNGKRTSPTTASQSNSPNVSTQPQASQSPVSQTASKPINSGSHHIASTSPSSQAVCTQLNSQTSHAHIHSGTTVFPSAATKTPHNSRQSKKMETASPLKCNGIMTAPVDTVSAEATCSTSSTSDKLTKTQTSSSLEDMKKSPKHSVSTQPSKVNSATQQIPRTRHNERLAYTHPKLISSVATKSQSTTCNSDADSTAKVTANKPKVVNGFDTKHINGSASTEELAGHNFPQQKNSHPDNVCEKPAASSVAASVLLSKKVTLPKLHGKHTRVSVPVESGCALVAVNGPMQADISSSGRQEHFDHSDQGDTDEEVEKAFDGHSDTLSKLCSIFPPHVKSLGDDDDLTFPASGSDNEDFSFSDGFDLGYDSPPIEMKEANNWKPDEVQTVSRNGEDEADGVALCPEQDSDKGIGPSNKGSAGTSSPAKVNPTPAPTRTVTRSSTGSIPKRKTVPETVDFPKRIRRSSGAGDRPSNHVPLIQCVRSHEKEDVEVMGTDNATNKPGKEEKSGKDADSKPVKERMETEKSRNSQKSPIVVLTKSPVRGVKKKKQKKDIGNKALNTVTRFLPRGRDGRFLSTGERVSFGMRHASQVKREDTDDDEPLIVVQRRNSRGESNGANNSDRSEDDIKTESSALTQIKNTHKEKSEAQAKRAPIKTETTVTDNKVESSSDRTDSKPTSELTVNGFCNSSSKLKTNTPSAKSLPLDDTFTMSCATTSVVTADIVNMSSASLDKSAPGTPASASSSTAGTPRKRGRPKKGEEISPQMKKNKSSKNKKKKKDFKRQHSEDDSFTTMKLSKTLNLMQNKKKKGEGSQSVSGLFSPFVRVHGKKQEPSVVSVFNHPLSEKTDPKSAGKKKTVTGSAPVMTSIPITNFSSDKTVMLPATRTDTSPWVCALCGMRSSYRFMGDLFGPYYLESHLAILNKADASKDSKKGTGSNTAADVKMTRRRSVGSRTSSAGGESSEMPQEVWVHEDCAMWSNGVYLVGSRIYGLEEALKAATATMCACCREKGAMLGCLHKGCNQNFHYMCAVDKDCYLDVENFCMLCPKHKDKRLKSAASTPSTSRL